ncbi:MAG TPA: antitoxin Xre-like helix-turn-helix domain-containing protein, partial [Candidatus Baltobacteraceae bacterium]|nr:antitoxin Xre-like helix-turn-helix domain-containing protein [Candidatus Baltobacteraceae bacterium]
MREILAGAPRSDNQIINAVTGGLPASALDDLLEAGLELAEIARVVGVSERTLQRKRGTAGTLDVAESDRTVRLARILAQADRYIGEHGKALRWLRTRNWALGDRVPLDLLATEPGVEMVRQSLVTIAYG